MMKAKVPKHLRREILKDLVARLRLAQFLSAQEKGLGPISPIANAGTVRKDDIN